MKTEVMTALLAGLTLIAGSSSAADQNARRGKMRQAIVRQYDANGNGTLDADEEAAVLKKYDANGDGELDRDEKVGLVKDLAGKRQPHTGAAGEETQGDVSPSKWMTVGFRPANTLGGGKADIPKTGILRVYVLMGQSNMVGMGKGSELKAPYNKKHERIRIWANGRWEYLVPSRTFGPEVSMAHQLAEFWPDDTIGIIKVAVGGTGICGFEKNWSKERADRTFDGKKGPLYKDLMHAVEEAKKISPLAFSGFVWKQGGADGTRKDLADEYLDTFTQLVSDLREDLGAPELPAFVLSYCNDEDLVEVEKSYSGKRKYMMKVLAAQNRAARDIPNTVTIHHGTLPKVDAVHFNTEGQITLGKMTADAVKASYRSLNK